MKNRRFSRIFMLLLTGMLAVTLMLLLRGEAQKQAAYTETVGEANRAAADRQKIAGEAARIDDREAVSAGSGAGEERGSSEAAAPAGTEDRTDEDAAAEKIPAGKAAADKNVPEEKADKEKADDKKKTDSTSSEKTPDKESDKKSEKTAEDVSVWNKEAAEKKLEEILASELTDEKVMLDVPEVFQNPELPTGCESVALTIDLNALGCDIEKTVIAKDYLVTGTDLATSYVGDPFSEGGAGTFPPGLIRTAEAYLKENAEDIFAFDTSDTDLEDLYRVMQAGYPVIVWTTMFMDEPMFINNEGEFQWFRNEHCVVLYGYDLKKGIVEVSDPLGGLVSRDAEDFAGIFEATGKCSVVLLNEDGVARNENAKTENKAKVDNSVKKEDSGYTEILEWRGYTQMTYFSGNSGENEESKKTESKKTESTGTDKDKKPESGSDSSGKTAEKGTETASGSDTKPAAADQSAGAGSSSSGGSAQRPDASEGSSAGGNTGSGDVSGGSAGSGDVSGGDAGSGDISGGSAGGGDVSGGDTGGGDVTGGDTGGGDVTGGGTGGGDATGGDTGGGDVTGGDMSGGDTGGGDMSGGAAAAAEAAAE